MMVTTHGAFTQYMGNVYNNATLTLPDIFTDLFVLTPTSGVFAQNLPGSILLCCFWFVKNFRTCFADLDDLDFINHFLRWYDSIITHFFPTYKLFHAKSSKNENFCRLFFYKNLMICLPKHHLTHHVGSVWVIAGRIQKFY